MKSYRSLIAWQKASRFSVAILQTLDAAWKPRSAAVFDQLRRAAVSADVNIVEGYALGTVPLYRKHLRIAVGSAAEAERLLEICSTRGYLEADVAAGLARQVEEVLATLFGVLRTPRLGWKKPTR
jgi:four helix bundle protein